MLRTVTGACLLKLVAAVRARRSAIRTQLVSPVKSLITLDSATLGERFGPHHSRCPTRFACLVFLNSKYRKPSSSPPIASADLTPVHFLCQKSRLQLLSWFGLSASTASIQSKNFGAASIMQSLAVILPLAQTQAPTSLRCSRARHFFPLPKQLSAHSDPVSFIHTRLLPSQPDSLHSLSPIP